MVMGRATPPTCSITLEAVLLGGGGELSCGSGSHQLRGFWGHGGAARRAVEAAVGGDGWKGNSRDYYYPVTQPPSPPSPNRGGPTLLGAPRSPYNHTKTRWVRVPFESTSPLTNIAA